MKMTKPVDHRNRLGVVSPAHFFTSDADKIKINWFLFEFAAEIKSHIGKPLKKRLEKAGVTEEALAGFCIHYSKTMKYQILQQVAGRQSHINLSHLPINEYCPSLSDKLVDDLLSAAGAEWNDLTDMCVACPTRCISEKDRVCDMFDDPDYYE